MKRILLLVFLIPQLGFGVTANDIPAILDTSGQIEQTARNLREFARAIKVLADNNFAYTVPQSTVTVTLTNPQKADLLSRYENMKSDLASQVGQLP